MLGNVESAHVPYNWKPSSITTSWMYASSVTLNRMERKNFHRGCSVPVISCRFLNSVMSQSILFCERWLASVLRAPRCGISKISCIQSLLNYYVYFAFVRADTRIQILRYPCTSLTWNIRYSLPGWIQGVTGTLVDGVKSRCNYNYLLAALFI